MYYQRYKPEHIQYAFIVDATEYQHDATQIAVKSTVS